MLGWDAFLRLHRPVFLQDDSLVCERDRKVRLLVPSQLGEAGGELGLAGSRHPDLLVPSSRGVGSDGYENSPGLSKIPQNRDLPPGRVVVKPPPERVRIGDPVP